MSGVSSTTVHQAGKLSRIITRETLKKQSHVLGGALINVCHEFPRSTTTILFFPRLWVPLTIRTVGMRLAASMWQAEQHDSAMMHSSLMNKPLDFSCCLRKHCRLSSETPDLKPNDNVVYLMNMKHSPKGSEHHRARNEKHM